MQKRIEELDYLKCIFIILMVAFHLVYIGDKYPYLKSIVYTFHMPGFLIISGYLFNTVKKTNSFLRMIIWIFIPYAIMETSYVIMASVLPIREHIADLTPLLLIKKIFIDPIGPYWYLHTLVLCAIIWYAIDNITPLNSISRIIITGICYFALSYFFNIISFDNAIYFMAGAIIRKSNIKFITIFQPSKLSIIPVILLCSFQHNLNRGTLAGVTITYLTISFLLATYPYLSSNLKKICGFVGRNTLIILLFSPIFTLLSKYLVPFFTFDSTGILFCLIAVTFTISGSFLIAKTMDILGISRFFFGKRQSLNKI